MEKRLTGFENKIIRIDVLSVLFILFFCIYYGHASLYVNILNITLDLKPLVFIVLVCFSLFSFLVDFLRKNLYLKQYSFFLWYIGFFLYCFVSILWTLNLDLSMEMLNGMLITAAALFSVTYYVNSESRFLRIIKIQLFSFCYMALRLIVLLPEKHLFGRGLNKFYMVEIIGVHYNVLAFFMSLGIVMAVFLYLRLKTRLILIIVPFFYYMIFLGGSRQGIIVPIASLLFLYMLFKGIKQSYKTIIILCVVVGLYVLYINSDLPGASQMLSLVNGFLGGTVETSFNERVLFRRMAVDMFTQRPVFGWGINSFKAHLGNINYFKLSYSCHNNYLEILMCLGVVGFLIYYSMYFKLLVQAFKRVIFKNIFVLFSITICFMLLLLELNEALFYHPLGLTSAIALFHAYYALKISNQKPEENR
jgi:O-antigen ligase